MKDLNGRVAVVTGAAGGIGRALALALAREGASVAVSDVRDTVERTAADVRAAGRAASAHVHDVADESAWPPFVEAVLAAHGHVDLVVNNAGVAIVAPFADTDPADARWLMGINFWGVYHGCRQFLPHLLTRPEAHVVNISSVFGLFGVPDNSLYCASKFAVRGLTESLMVELADTAVSFTSVHPGAVATDIARDARMPGEGGVSRRTALKSIANGVRPEEAAATILGAIRRKQERVLVGRDAWAIDKMVRAAPVQHRRVVARVSDRMRRKR